MKGKKCKAGGGGILPMKASGNPNVIKEAEERKKGGRVKKGMMADGEKSKHRMDRPRRASGGGVNATNHPFSSAHKGGAAGERRAGKPD